MNQRSFGVLIVAAVTCAAPGTASGQQLTVYSSLPLSGPQRPTTTAVNNGARLALQEAGGTAAGRPVRFVALNDATRRAGTWTPQQVSRNARRAAKDASTVAYIGEFNSAASSIAVPILSEVGIATISPSNTYVGLTRDGPGTSRGEPEKYYPTNRRTYFRLVPNDAVQGAALATAMRDRGCTRIASLTDGELYGGGTGSYLRQSAGTLGLGVVRARSIDRRARNYRALANRLRRAKADCVAFTGVTGNGAIQLFKDVGRRLPRAQLFGSDGVAESRLARGLPASVARRVIVTVQVLAPAGYPPAGQALFNRFGDPYALYGYEAMKLVLDGLNAAGPSREALLGWLPTVQGRAGVIGTYGFDANGDTTLRTWGLYTIRGRQLTWVGPINAA